MCESFKGFANQSIDWSRSNRSNLCRLPPLPNSPSSEPRVLEIQVPASALQENKLHSALTATPIIQSIMTLPPAVAASVLQQHINAVLASGGTPIAKQVDGTADTSDEDGSDVSDDNLDNDDEDDNMQVRIGWTSFRTVELSTKF